MPITFLIALLLITVAEDPERDALLSKAQSSVEAATTRVQGDPMRPVYHVLPPANWNNDPNGPLFYKGRYHLFYQHNPYGDEWGHMHWGHVRSNDLARWEHLPIALWPSKSKGEDHVFSGSAWTRQDGTPVIFYTSIGEGRAPEQWAAIPEDDDLIKWKKHPANPILTESIHGETKVHEWRDPYLFEVGGKVYMVCGGNLNASQGGEGAVFVYRAEDDELTKWTYLGVLFKHPDAAVKNIECPIFFKANGRWVLIVSQGQPVDWFVGDLDESTMRFTPKTRGKVDYGQVYAPSVLAQNVDRPILWGWVNGVPPGKGWRHCLTLPRVLSVNSAGQLVQAPVLATERLTGGRAAEARDVVLEGLGRISVESNALEIVAVFETGPNRTAALEIVSGDGKARLPITFEEGELDVGGTRAPVTLAANELLWLTIFVDHSVIEVTANYGGAWVTRVVDFVPAEVVVRAPGNGPPVALRQLDAWVMRPCWIEK